jgi:hypothetical protein
MKDEALAVDAVVVAGAPDETVVDAIAVVGEVLIADPDRDSTDVAVTIVEPLSKLKSLDVAVCGPWNGVASRVWPLDVLVSCAKLWQISTALKIIPLF